MQEIQVILTDTHFGIKNNSLLWLKSQEDYIYNEFIPYLKDLKRKQSCELTVIHCGDLFDSRSSINPYIYFKVENILQEISKIVDRVIVLAGNHDFYSQNDTPDNVCSLDMLHSIEKVCFLSNTSLILKGAKAAFIPWFEFHNPEKLERAAKDCKLIFTHTDLQHLDKELYDIIKDKAVISGHIHVPYSKDNKFNIGACWSMNFADSNSERGIYTLENWDINTLKLVENTESIKFFRVYNDTIFEEPSFSEHDKVEIYIDKNLYTKPDYAERLKELNSKADCKIIVVENDISSKTETVDSSEWNILDMVENTIPDFLKNKFKKILSEL